MDVRKITIFYAVSIDSIVLAPRNNIDIYLHAFIGDLKELWEVRVKTYVVSEKKNFN